MSDSVDKQAGDEIERLRRALDAETKRCLDLRRQLDRANADFEEFVSMAAHNVRESLRDVASYSQLLAETCASRLDADGSAFLARIQEGTARMEWLLTDVVDYWATGTGARQISTTDMEAVLRQSLLSTDKQITEHGAVVTHDPLPAVMGDFATLAKVLHHLLKNAIEYRGASPPRIHISCSRGDPDWIFSVRDNGPGIDPAFESRIFEAFKRLHGKEHPGNGLGLAFCKKVIEWQGGRMYLESTPGAGSTFYFTLPRPV